MTSLETSRVCRVVGCVVACGALVAALAGCAHSQTREGVLAAATHELECDDPRLAVTEYATYEATVEGCRRVGHFTFLDGDWRLYSRCEYRVTPSIPSCCSPNRGGESTCVAECTGYDECTAHSQSRASDGDGQ